MSVFKIVVFNQSPLDLEGLLDLSYITLIHVQKEDYNISNNSQAGDKIHRFYNSKPKFDHVQSSQQVSLKR